MAYILALDQGTTSSRAILFDEAGTIAAVAQHEFRQIYPQPGWVEHDPTEILTSQMACAVEALGKAGARPRDVAAIGITNQRETTWCGIARPASRSIPRSCGRTVAPPRSAASSEKSGAGEAVAAKTGLVLDPYFSGTKVAWILDNVAGRAARAERGELAFGTIDSWLIWKLTSGKRHVTDVTNASRTLLFNIVKGEWDADCCESSMFPTSCCREVAWSSERIGEVTTSLGLGGVPIAGIAGDQQAALFGQLCLNAGEPRTPTARAASCCRTSAREFVRSKHRLITTLAASAQQAPGIRARRQHLHRRRGGAVAARRPGDHRDVGRGRGARRGVPDTGGVVFVPAFAGLGAPHWDPYARGDDHRPAARHEAGHIARAALESIAFQVADVLEAMHSETGTPLGELRVDGGAAANDLLMQFQADCWACRWCGRR